MKLSSVGIEDIKFPVKIRQKKGGHQQTVAEVNLRVDMPRSSRDSCITIITTVLNKYQDDLSVTVFPQLLSEIKDELKAESAHMEMTFPYFIEKKAPVSGTASLMEYKCCFTGGIDRQHDLIISVWVPVTTLCPCSKEISECGAHNQRAEVNFNVRYQGFIWVEDLITLVESTASCEVFALLKRPDEKYVTERAFNNPMFVEDVVRRVAEQALTLPDISWFSVGVESFESIHKHSAYAFVDSTELR
ncbi:MAG: GTP cyclohydrolase I FolE2 [Proteobacteria bacterium]|nr:GTP cyclohydrolase I FolE2 [Pseudomonadota bacterium]MBU1686717.1 GTP cyclohydrolase I FolE2 [Pseudomonadota bacterium]